MINNRWFYVLMMPLMALFFVACEDEVSYSDMKDKERAAISKFINSEGIKVITMDKFFAQDTITDVSDNEYVLIDNVYVQFVNNPKGKPGAKKLNNNSSLNLLVRYKELNILEGEEYSTNLNEADPDEMTIKNEGGNYSAHFSSGVMLNTYGSMAVPTGWLVPMPYLYFVRSSENLAQINIIVPHTEGTSPAATYVYPCFYNITFQLE